MGLANSVPMGKHGPCAPAARDEGDVAGSVMISLLSNSRCRYVRRPRRGPQSMIGLQHVLACALHVLDHVRRACAVQHLADWFYQEQMLLLPIPVAGHRVALAWRRSVDQIEKPARNSRSPSRSIASAWMNSNG